MFRCLHQLPDWLELPGAVILLVAVAPNLAGYTFRADLLGEVICLVIGSKLLQEHIRASGRPSRRASACPTPSASSCSLSTRFGPWCSASCRHNCWSCAACCSGLFFCQTVLSHRSGPMEGVYVSASMLSFRSIDALLVSHPPSGVVRPELSS
jgi:hypothetical protein